MIKNRKTQKKIQRITKKNQNNINPFVRSSKFIADLKEKYNFFSNT
jgi:hypothetical protein